MLEELYQIWREEELTKEGRLGTLLPLESKASPKASLTLTSM